MANTFKIMRASRCKRIYMVGNTGFATKEGAQNYKKRKNLKSKVLPKIVCPLGRRAILSRKRGIKRRHKQSAFDYTAPQIAEEEEFKSWKKRHPEYFKE